MLSSDDDCVSEGEQVCDDGQDNDRPQVKIRDEQPIPLSTEKSNVSSKFFSPCRPYKGFFSDHPYLF